MKTSNKFNPKAESLNKYLTRIARVLDDLKNVEDVPFLDDETVAISKAEEKELKDYLAVLLTPIFLEKSRTAAFKKKLDGEQGVIYSYLSMTILDHLYKYNNPNYTKVAVKRSFDAFLGPYLKEAVDETLGEKLGATKYRRKMINHINKTIEIICLEYAKEWEDVTVDEIFENQKKTGDIMFLSKCSIKRAMDNWIEEPYHYDGNEEFFVESHDDYSHFENEEAEKCVRAFLDTLSDAERFLFLARCLNDGKGYSFKEIGSDPVFLKICRSDASYSIHIQFGDPDIERPKSGSVSSNMGEETEYVDPVHLERQCRTLKRRFARLEDPEQGLARLDLIKALVNMI